MPASNYLALIKYEEPPNVGGTHSQRWDAGW